MLVETTVSQAHTNNTPQLPVSETDPSWFLSGQTDANSPVRRVTVHSSPFTVGRKSDCALNLATSSVSKLHAELILDGERLVIRDLGSTNGTYVNGERLDDELQLCDGDLVQFATAVFRVGSGTNSMSDNTIEENACDRALAMMQFDRLINDGGLLPYFQPIVRMSDRTAMGFEVLGRSRLFGLKSPAEMFAAASELNLEGKLSESFRIRGLEDSAALPDEFNLFLNTHPAELGTPELLESLHSLRDQFPDQQMTLEIHEAAVTNPSMMQKLRAVLEDLSIQLAFDDFGEGRARLVELGEAKPHFVKFDMKLTRCISRAPSERQGIVATIANLVQELGIVVLAEGVESIEDHEILVEMGFDLGQGYFYGRPNRLSKYQEHLHSAMPFNDTVSCDIDPDI